MGAATGHDKASQIVAIEPWPGKFNGHTYGWVCVPSTSMWIGYTTVMHALSLKYTMSLCPVSYTHLTLPTIYSV